MTLKEATDQLNDELGNNEAWLTVKIHLGMYMQTKSLAQLVKEQETLKPKKSFSAWWILLIFAILVPLAMIMATPADDELLQQVTEHYVGRNTVSKYLGEFSGTLYQVDNRIFSKHVTNKITGATVAYTVGSMVFFTN